MSTSTTERPARERATWVCDNCHGRTTAACASAARSAGPPATDAGVSAPGARRAAGRRPPGSAARRRGARPSGPTGDRPSQQPRPVAGGGVLQRQPEHQQLLAGGEPAVRRVRRSPPSPRAGRWAAEQRQERALLVVGLRVDGVGERPGRPTRRPSRAGLGRRPPTAGRRWRRRAACGRSARSGRSTRRARPGPRRGGSGTVRSSAGQTASRSTVWWCSSTRPIRSACRVSVGGALGLVVGRPGGQVGEQPQLAPDQLVQHALVGDGAAGDRSCGDGAVPGAERRRAAARGAGIRRGRADRGCGHANTSFGGRAGAPAVLPERMPGRVGPTGGDATGTFGYGPGADRSLGLRRVVAGSCAAPDAPVRAGDRRHRARRRHRVDGWATSSSATAVRVSGVPGGPADASSCTASAATRRMWRFVAPDFEVDHRVVLFDQVGSGDSDLSRLRPGEVRRRCAATPTDVVEICRELELHRRRLRRALGQRDDRRPRAAAGAGAVRRAGDGRARARATSTTATTSVGFSRDRHRRAARRARQQPPRLVGPDGAGDHGQPRPPGAGRGADQQLLPHRPRRSPASSRGSRSCPTTAPTCPRSPSPPSCCSAARTSSPPRSSAGTCTSTIPGSVFTQLERHRSLPAPERSGGDDGRDPGLPLGVSRADGRSARRDPDAARSSTGCSRRTRPTSTRTRRWATCRRCPTARIVKVNRTFCAWTGRSADELHRHAVPGPAQRRRPGLPRDPPARRCCGCRGRCGRSRSTSSGSTARCCRACSTPSSCATRTARRCWCGRRCSRRRRGAATSASCWPRSGPPRSRRRGRGSCSGWSPTSRRRPRCEDVAAVIVERGRGGDAGARCRRWCWSTSEPATRSGLPGLRPVRVRGPAAGAAGGAAARRRAGSSPWSSAQGVRTVPLDDRLRAAQPGVAAAMAAAGLTALVIVPVTADSRRLGVLILGLGTAAPEDLISLDEPDGRAGTGRRPTSTCCGRSAGRPGRRWSGRGCTRRRRGRPSGRRSCSRRRGCWPAPRTSPRPWSGWPDLAVRAAGRPLRHRPRDRAGLDPGGGAAPRPGAPAPGRRAAGAAPAGRARTPHPSMRALQRGRHAVGPRGGRRRSSRAIDVRPASTSRRSRALELASIVAVPLIADGPAARRAHPGRRPAPRRRSPRPTSRSPSSWGCRCRSSSPRRSATSSTSGRRTRCRPTCCRRRRPTSPGCRRRCATWPRRRAWRSAATSTTSSQLPDEPGGAGGRRRRRPRHHRGGDDGPAHQRVPGAAGRRGRRRAR